MRHRQCVINYMISSAVHVTA